jgi:hypothetical protein
MKSEKVRTSGLSGSFWNTRFVGSNRAGVLVMIVPFDRVTTDGAY